MSQKKIVSLELLAGLVAQARAKGLVVAHCHGCFDLMHPGHILHFQAARKLGDLLVVTVTPDEFVDKGQGRPVFPQELRLLSIAALACVDYVAVNLWPTAVQTIHLLRPNYYVKGQEFQNLEDPAGKIGPENDALREVGGELRFTQEQVFSSTALLNTYFCKKPQ